MNAEGVQGSCVPVCQNIDKQNPKNSVIVNELVDESLEFPHPRGVNIFSSFRYKCIGLPMDAFQRLGIFMHFSAWHWDEECMSYH